MINFDEEPPRHDPNLDSRVRKALSSSGLTSAQKDELSYLYGISLLSQAVVVQFLDDLGG